MSDLYFASSCKRQFNKDFREEDGGVYSLIIINNLGPQQLKAPAKAIFRNGNLDGDEAEDTNAAEGSLHHLPQTFLANSKRQK